MSIAATWRVTASAVVPWVDPALSPEAQRLRRLAISATDSRDSSAVGETRRLWQEALYAAYAGAQEDNWDGMGSARVEATTYAYAAQFLQIVPSTIPAPAISVDTDGEILVEWDRDRRWVFSVSVGRDGTLTYAGLYGHDKIHGTEYLREALSPVIALCLRRILDGPAR